MRTKKAVINLLILVAISGTILVCYHHVFNAPFVFDDQRIIVENYRIRNPENFYSDEIVWTQRPLADLTFSLNYQYGQFEVFGYHLVNYFIHVLAAWLVYLLAGKIFSIASGNDDTDRGRKIYILPAVFSALVFALHPIQTQSVTYIVQRYTSLAALFYLGSIFFYIWGRQSLLSGKARQPSRAGRGRFIPPLGASVLFSLSILSGTASFLCKQNALSLPLSLILIEYLLYDRTWTGWKKKIIYLGTPCALLIIFALFGIGIVQSDGSLGQLLAEADQRTRETVDISRGQYLLTQFRVVSIYLGLMIYPLNLSLDYMYPMVDNLFQGWTLFGGVLLLGLIGLGIRIRKFAPVVSLGILWYFITLSVESGLIPIRDALFEHRLYLPMFGFSLLLGWGFHKAYTRWKRTTVSLALIILCFLAQATYQRNRVWRSPISLWADTASKHPDNPRAYNNLGRALEEVGNLEEAVQHYRKALGLESQYADAHLNLGLVLAKAGKLEKAEMHFIRAIELKPAMAKPHYNLALVRQAQGRVQAARELYETALFYAPEMIDARMNLAGVLAEAKRYPEAINHLNRILWQEPGNFDALVNLGNVYYLSGKSGKAIESLRRALEINPDNEQAKNMFTLARQDDIIPQIKDTSAY